MSAPVTQYEALITSEHNQQPDFMAVIDATLQPAADITAALQYISGLFNLDTAVGQQLDFVGQWIGPTRDVYIPITGNFFSFDTVDVGFDQGFWTNSGDATVLYQLPDAEYRTLLYATVAANHWKGTVPDAIKLLNSFWNPLGYQMYVIDGMDMTMSFILTGTLQPNAILLYLFNNGYLDVVPAGVGVLVHAINTTGNPFFGFDQEDPLISGFNVGYWSGQANGGYNPPEGASVIWRFTGTYSPPAGGSLIFNF